MANPQAATKEEENYKNYGSVDLNGGAGLSPDWRRDYNDLSLIAMTIVGHENGTADAYLKADPRARHQFSWCAPYDREKIAMLKMQGYKPVIEGTWEKNPLLWDWQEDEKDKEGPKYCTRFEDRLWARPEARYLADKERRAARPDATKIVNSDLAAQAGAATARDQNGVALRPTTR